MRVLASLLLFLAVWSTPARATSCARLPACQRGGEGEILFTGIVTDPGTPSDQTHPVRVQVEEIFVGLPRGMRDVTVEIEGDWLVRGPVYLFDLVKNKEGRFYPATCGNTGEADAEYNTELITFLRDYAQGKTKTTLNILTATDNGAVRGALVSVQGPSGTKSGVTDEKGNVVFDGILPGQYEVAATKQNYDNDPASSFSKTVTVEPRSCAIKVITLKVRTEVSGTLVNSIGQPLPDIDLTLVEPESEGKTFHQTYTETTDDNGEFRFTGVTPGEYRLGVSILYGPDTPYPPTWYPGFPDSSRAAPLYVTTEKSLTSLVFRLPDFGKLRTVTICAVDEESRPVGGILFSDARNSVRGTGSAGILKSDSSGCGTFRAFEKVRYALNGSLYPTPFIVSKDLKNIRHTDPVVIEPGEGPVQRTVLLKPLPRN